MARQFASYSPVVPLGTTWEETLRYLDEDGNPVDLTDCDFRAQIREAVPARDPETGEGDTEPLLEIVNRADLYATAPDWPLVEGFAAGLDPDAPDPTDGYLRLRVEVADVWRLSPNNARARLVWDIEIIDAGDDDAVLPLVQGRVIALPRRTLGLPS